MFSEHTTRQLMPIGHHSNNLKEPHTTATTISANLRHDDVHLSPQPPECIHELLRLPMDAHPAAIHKDLGSTAKQRGTESQQSYRRALDYLPLPSQPMTIGNSNMKCYNKYKPCRYAYMYWYMYMGSHDDGRSKSEQLYYFSVCNKWC